MGYRIPGTNLYRFPESRMVREPWTNKQQTADALGVHPKWLERRHRASGFPVSYSANGRARYRLSEVREWIAAQGSNSGDAA